tara:strand:- start:13667 stop:14092 length:426 start_codon:yes stop_codon:yes gene_type:complete
VARKKIKIPKNYKPEPKEKFMNSIMREYFRLKLIAWRKEILGETGETLEKLRKDNAPASDLADRAAVETERAVELRTRDRARKLVSKIDEALGRIEDGSYGYCEETDEPISLKRLEARPIATLSLEAQEQHERYEKTHRDD